MEGLVDPAAYQRFETMVAFLLTIVIASVVPVALYQLVVRVIESLVLRRLNPLAHARAG
jgi:type III secretion system FlhB-like substrate exporter